MLLHVVQLDEWEDMNAMVQEAMKQSTQPLGTAEIGQECIVKDNAFESTANDAGYRRAVILDPEKVPSLKGKATKGRVYVEEVDTSKNRIQPTLLLRFNSR